MANMFIGMDMVQIPKNIQECTKTDNMTRNLWTWAQRLETWGKILCVIIIVAGTVLAIIEANQVKEVTTSVYSYYSTKEVKEFSFEVFISEFIQDLFIGIITYFIFHSIALLIGGLASIVQHTKISAKVSLMQTQQSQQSSDGNIVNVDALAEEAKQSELSNKANHQKTRMIEEWNYSTGPQEGVCEFCGEKKTVRQMIIKGEMSGKVLNWLCDDCIEKYSKPE